MLSRGDQPQDDHRAMATLKLHSTMIPDQVGTAASSMENAAFQQGQSRGNQPQTGHRALPCGRGRCQKAVRGVYPAALGAHVTALAVDAERASRGRGLQPAYCPGEPDKNPSRPDTGGGRKLGQHPNQCDRRRHKGTLGNRRQVRTKPSRDTKRTRDRARGAGRRPSARPTAAG